MIKGNFNEKGTPARPEKRGGIRGETPTPNLQQFLENESGNFEGTRYDYYYKTPHGIIYCQNNFLKF